MHYPLIVKPEATKTKPILLIQGISLRYHNVSSFTTGFTKRKPYSILIAVTTKDIKMQFIIYVTFSSFPCNLHPLANLRKLLVTETCAESSQTGLTWHAFAKRAGPGRLGIESTAAPYLVTLLSCNNFWRVLMLDILNKSAKFKTRINILGEINKKYWSPKPLIENVTPAKW